MVSAVNPRADCPLSDVEELAHDQPADLGCDAEDEDAQQDDCRVLPGRIADHLPEIAPGLLWRAFSAGDCRRAARWSVIPAPPPGQFPAGDRSARLGPLPAGRARRIRGFCPSSRMRISSARCTVPSRWATMMAVRLATELVHRLLDQVLGGRVKA